MWKLKLVEGWQRAWSWLSMQVAAIGVVFGTLAHEVQVSVLDFVGIGQERVPLVLGLLMMVGRLISQTPRQPSDDPPDQPR